MAPGQSLNNIAGLRSAVGARLREQATASPCALDSDYDGTVDLLLSRVLREALHEDAEVDAWIEARRSTALLQTEVVPLDLIKQWSRDPSTGNIAHRSGRFFSITGLVVRHRMLTAELEWDQPIIDQPEIGILGILAKRFNGILHFCLQAKEEPGNIHSIQLSPTVQATYSNYSRVHGGALPPFLEYFVDIPAEQLLYAKLQTEDGGRFLFKSNRNMIVLLRDDDAVSLPEGFIWLSLRQIAERIQRDNLFNACARSVLSSLFGLLHLSAVQQTVTEFLQDGTWAGRLEAATDRLLQGEGACADGKAPFSLGDTIQWLDEMKARNHIFQKRVGLNTLADWGMNSDGFFAHKLGKYFKVIGINVTSPSREVASWSQPILDNVGTGIIGLLAKRERGRTFLLMQAKAEVGNRGIVQIGPTVQFTQENYTDNGRLKKPFLFDEFMGPNRFPLLREGRQSEEGARFFREEHLHRVLLLPEGTRLELPSEFRWMSVEELRWFLHFGEQVNSCARSILSTLL